MTNCEYCKRGDLHSSAECSTKSPLVGSDFGGGSLDSSQAFSSAEMSGGVVVLPADNELFLDIDSTEALNRFHTSLPKLSEYVGYYDWVEKPSRSGNPERCHITVKLDRSVTPTERILLQAVLGSDLRRELLSYCRITIGDPNPTLFIEGGQKLLGSGTELAVVTT